MNSGVFPDAIAWGMQFKYAKATFGTAWVVAVCIAAVVAGVTSPSGWLLVTTLAVAPLAVSWWLWRPLAQTISESIHNAR